MDREGLTARDLLKTSRILTSTPDKTLKEALVSVSRSHDAVFVFDRNDKFLGVISPYHVIFKSKSPPNTKLANCLFKPPSIFPDTYIWDIARLMVESKVYYLPVFKNDHFEGIVTVTRVYRAVLKMHNLAKRINIGTKKNLIIVQKNAMLAEAYGLMRDKRVARLPVVNKVGSIIGIVTRFDLRVALSEPKEKMSWLSRAGNKKKYLNHTLEGYYKKIVITAKQDFPVYQLIKIMLDKQVGSVVIVDGNRKPVGIVSSHDILKAISNLKPEKSAKIDLKVDERFAHKARLSQILSGFVSKINKFSPIKRVGFVVESIRNPVGKIKRYTVHVHLFLKSGKEVVAKVTAYDWEKAVREALGKIRRQLLS